MLGEDGDYVTWLRVEATGSPENLFLVVLERCGNVNLMPCTPREECNVLLLLEEHARLIGLSPFRRVATFVLVPCSAPAPVSSHLGTRAQLWISSGETWSKVAQPHATTFSDDEDSE